MKTPAFTVIALAAMTGLAIAADTPSEDVTTEAMEDHPGTKEQGTTDMPTSEPETDSLSDADEKTPN